MNLRLCLSLGLGPSQRRAENGFTFVEVAISLAIFAMLLASVFSIMVETSSFLRNNEDDVVVQTEGNRVFQRFADVLRKSGRVTAGGFNYPRVTNGGSELEFKVLSDLDGNGFAYDGTTGVLEWDPAVYTLKTDGAGNLGVYSGGTKVYSLGRFIQNLRFETIAEDSALHLKEIRITYEARKPTGMGFDMVQSVSASVHMRN